MTIAYKSGRQEVISAEIEIGYADLLGLSGTQQDAIQVPAGARLVSGDVTVLEAFNSATSDVLRIGDAGSATRYAGSDINLAATGRTALTLTGYEHTVEEFIKARWTGTGTAPTAGKFRLSFQYVVKGRVAFSQGLDYRGAGIRGA
jgi:hypothetical protein